MIQITRIENGYLEALEKFMTRESLDYKEVSLCLETLFVVLDGRQVLGFGYYNIYGDDVYIDHIYIGQSDRLNKLGDSLFRALLNSLYIQGLESVYMRNNELYHDFLVKENIGLESEQRFVIHLNDFFNRKCKSEKALKTPLN